MMRRRRIGSAALLATAAALALVALPSLVILPTRILWNVSSSVPIGLYRVAPITAPALGDLVAVMPPEPLARFLAVRSYLGEDVPLIKRVAALSGQTVCRLDERVLIDGAVVAVAQARDNLGRALPDWQGCRVLGADDVLFLNAEPRSLDGRYFGPLSRGSILGRAVPVWTDEAT